MTGTYTKRSTYVDPEDILLEMGFGTSKQVFLTANSGVSEANPRLVTVGAHFVSRFVIGSKVAMYNQDSAAKNAEIQEMEYGTVASIQPTTITLTEDMTYDFTTAKNAVTVMLSKYTQNTFPRYQELDSLVMRMQDRVDMETHHTWGSRVVYSESHNFHSDARRYGFPQSIYPKRWNLRNTDFAIWLKHSDIKTLDDTVDTAYPGYLGDSLIVWDGTEYIEVVNAANPYGADSIDIWTEGRDDDFWLSYEPGILIFGDETPSFSFRAVKITYRYGQDMVDTLDTTNVSSAYRDIQQAVMAYCKAAILRDRRFNVDLPGGSGADALALQQAISSYENDAKRLLARHLKLFINTDRH